MNSQTLLDELRQIEPGSCSEKCDDDIYKKGQAVFVAASVRSSLVEHWVKTVAKESGQPVDWYMMGGRAVVLTTGDKDKVKDTIKEFLPSLETIYRETTERVFKDEELTLPIMWR